MDRRAFTQVLATAAFASTAVPALPALAASGASPSSDAASPFPLSVMLWTVFNDLPFEERLAKVAEAGYNNIELVGEYVKWTPADFDKASTQLLG
jgi:hydroxypyruvate isomerase